ncbi:DUF4270 domain-containing protein [Flavobacterium sp.]|uniref:DUF4270 domain-containing protein n=1 Tax=Flavobacterium sp. TaxID=239 RepID=UPI002636CAF9|nr:DUF4270 domain-containing protein [Flavobacterium sp.]
MKFNFLFKTFIIGLSILFFASCDKDFNELGSEIVGNENYSLNKEAIDVVAYNQNIGVYRTSDLPINSLGYYNNEVFGKTKASFVTQLQLVTSSPKFYRTSSNIIIDSVYLYVPYYSTFKSTDSNTGDSTYELDSIHGSSEIDLKVYESKYYLRDNDPSTGFQQPQYYYSNQQSDIEAPVDFSMPLNIDNRNIQDSTATPDNSQNSKFVFSNKQIKIYKNIGTANVAVKERLAPGMLLSLRKDFFRNKIFNAPAGVLYNNNIFEDYFRGLYFKVDNAISSVNQGTLAKLNFANGYIRIAYRDNTSETNTTLTRRTLDIKLGGHSVNLINSDWSSPVTSPNSIVGDDRLYLNGMGGSMAIIDLFAGTSGAAKLQDIKDKNWLVNEANLTFTIDNTAMGTVAPEPNRIYLYDLNNKRPLIDYFADLTTSNSSKYNKFVHGGIIQKNTSDRGTTYKIKITNHVRNLILKDSTNVKLGLVVTEAITNPLNVNLFTPFNNGSVTTKFVPAMSVVNPLGTILFGSNPSVPSNQRLKLEVYYTKPD